MLLTEMYLRAPSSTVVAALTAISCVLVATNSAAQTANVPRCGAGVHESEALGLVSFPQDQIFCPIVADPKEPRSFASLLRGTFRSLDDPSGGHHDRLGRPWGQFRSGPLGRTRPNEGVQLDVVGSIFAQFDLGAPSNDLINADYIDRPAAHVPAKRLQHAREGLPPELTPRGRVPAPKRRHRPRESLVRGRRAARLPGSWAHCVCTRAENGSFGASPTRCRRSYFTEAPSFAADGRADPAGERRGSQGDRPS